MRRQRNHRRRREGLQGLIGEPRAPRNGGDARRGLDGQRPVPPPRDPRRVVHVHHACDQAMEDSVRKLIPNVQFTFDHRHAPHGHLRAKLARDAGTFEILGMIRRSYPRAQVLDVGVTQRLRRNRLAANIHACEFGMDAYTQTKLRTLATTVPPLRDGAMHADNWSWCRCSASECQHCRPDLALFIHSIYHNSPEEVARILLRCNHRRGYSLHHEFPETQGTLYSGEARYFVADGQVTMTVTGNAGAYVHPHSRWLLDPRRGVHVTVDDVPYTLSIGDRIPAPCRQATILVLDLFEGHLPLNSPPAVDLLNLPDFPVNVKIEDLKPVDRRIILADFPTASHIWIGGIHLVLRLGDGAEVRIPRSAVDEVHRFLAGKKLDAKVFREAMGQARRLCRPEKNKGLPISSADLARAVPFIVRTAIERVASDSMSVFERWYTTGMGQNVQRHNKLLSFVFPDPWRYVKLGLLVTFIASLLATFGQFALNILTVTGTFFQRCGLALLGLRYYTFTPGLGAFMLLVLLTVFAPARSATDGSEFVRTVMDERRSTSYTGPLPNPCVFDGFESLIDVNDYPPDPRATYKVGVVEELPPKPALRCVGIGFTAAVPMVYSRSSHNLHIGVRTRAIASVPQPKPGAWAELDLLCKNLTHLHAEFGVPSCDAPDERLYGNFEKKITWDYFVKRFPPQKRKNLERTRQKVLDGDYRSSQLAYKGFIKREKLMKVTLDEFIPQRPRIIQGLSQLGKVLAGPWFLSYSNALKSDWNLYSRIWYSSGATTDMHNAWIENVLLELGPDVVYIYTDFSKYDMTQSVECLEREAAHYRALGFEDNVTLGADILKAMLHARVFYQQHRWSIPGTRKSGDLNTSSGNSKTTGEAMASWLIKYDLFNSSRTVVLGDDDLSAISRTAVIKRFGSMEAACESLKDHMTSLGFVVKVGFTTNLLTAEYVSCRFYPTMEGHRFGKKPGRVLTKIGYLMHKPNCSEETFLSYLHGTLISYLPTSNHVPFLRVYVNKLLKHLAHIAPKFEADWEFRPKGELCEADAETWIAFQAHYGLGPEEEEVFAGEVDVALAEGLPYMIHSEIVERLFKCDFDL